MTQPSRVARPLVLVFGDDRATRMEVRRDLLAHDYPVRVASTMAEAAKAVAAGGVGLVVLTPCGAPGDPGTLGYSLDHARDTFAVPVVRFERDSAQSIVELVRTAAGAHAESRHQDGDSE